MKILSLSPYFFPEQFSSRHLGEDLRRWQIEAGHTIELYAPTPTRGVSKEVRHQYKKIKLESLESGSLIVHRFPLIGEGRNPIFRALRYILCECKFAWHGLWAKNIDVLEVGSTPPIHALVGVFLKKTRKIPYVFTINDLFPESLVSTGMTRKGSLLWKIGSWVSNISYKHASKIVVISTQIKDSLIAKGVPEEKLVVLYNWIDEKATYPVKREDNKLYDEFNLSRDKFYVTYAGNLGASQNVQLLVDCAEKLKDVPDIQFVIFGSGTEEGNLRILIDERKLDNIVLYPMQPLERVSSVYSLGNMSLVACRKGVGEGAFPSKAVSIMATATPMLVSFDENSDLVRLVREKEVGVWAEPEDLDAAVEAILRCYREPDLCAKYGQNARRLVCETFAKDVNIPKRIKILEDVVVSSQSKSRKLTRNV